MNKNKSGNSGFTLVELSIVIVIIGLIVAGVTAGNSLIKQAKIRQAMTQLMSYQTAINTFKLTYNYFPGDIPVAYNYWGVAAGCTNTASSAGAHAGCNGNGDKTIDWDGEEQRFWQHLYLAKLINVSYTGIQGVARFTPGVDIPLFYSEGPKGGLAVGNESPKVNRLESNGYTRDGTSYNVATLTAATMYNMDLKMDDGKGNKGKIQSYATPVRFGNAAQTVTCHTAGVYNIVLTGEPACAIQAFF